jgi:pimeloyl-ACP methyl ester carboxylesterase
MFRSSRTRSAVRALAAAALVPVVAGSLLAATGASSSAASQAETATAKPTIVLVHGAFADASSWSEVVRRLQRDGYPVIATANPLRGLSDDAAYLRSVLDGVNGPVVLVGHSYGGSVITQAADRIRAFIAAAIADDLPVTADHDGEGHRVVRLGDVHAAPCGGTHVRRLAGLRQVTISAVKLKKGRLRVSYTAAHRPLR